MNDYQLLRRAALLAALLVACVPASAQSKTMFCFADGTTIGAERFETRDGKFFLYVAGSSTPLEYPVASVRGIDAPTCSPSQSATPSGKFGIHGSNTIGERLMPMIIEGFAVKNYGARPSFKPIAPEEQEIALHQGSDVKATIDFRAHGSKTAPEGLLAGKAQIGMSSSRMKQEYVDKIRDQFNTNSLASENEHVLAMDGIAVIVNQDSPVDQLTLEQLCRVFSGQATNWSELGGPDRPITVYRRDNKSGTFDTFKHLVLDTSACQKTIAASAHAFESSELLSAEVSKDLGGVGFIAMPYVGKNRALKIGSSCGVASSPSPFSIKSEEYPLSRRLYLYTVGQPNDPVARDVLKFALSDDAQPIIADAEFYNLAVEFQDPQEQRAWAGKISDNPTFGLPADKELSPVAVRAFSRAMEDSRRSSMEFRFETGSSALDTRAQQDVARLARYLRQLGSSSKRFQIVGFADTDGSWVRNERLARQRAETVAMQLRDAGVNMPRGAIQSFSFLAPVACNDTDAGKSKNRRVEVWIQR
ncbi:MAG: phosphate ABC transporter substrate-binding/OmpA family protein [Methylocystis sp.]